jgi:hypothetical protein
MKRLIYSLVLIFLFSCTKEEAPAFIDGTWTIVESNIGTGTGVEVYTYTPSSDITVRFEPNNLLVLTGANPGDARSPLWQYDRYEIRENSMIRFYQSNGREVMVAHYTIDGHLYLNYPWARCGHEEKFVRVK